ncbi:Glycoside hydrolase [Klebsormidium nitens]|uniref:mannan endo-1,4-beta-mannosidase n=1 Tax=Klebsormidium nitens TaxID=105231 RepID=A0A1Y1I679_KLENI|nr:Glycoside hydrolase [Klebsormidium nitens]|eukprot:GAQ84226.1 Glycoside hydrolase [Klebsormidium nitens]
MGGLPVVFIGICFLLCDASITTAGNPSSSAGDDGYDKNLLTPNGIAAANQEDSDHFVKRQGHQFTLNGKRFFVHGHSYGGSLQYLTWSKERGGRVTTTDDALGDSEQFYTDDLCKEFYKSYVKSILQRTNTFTKRVYRDDPTIFAFDLINEPRAPLHPNGNELQAWIEEMSSFLRNEDPNHLISVGLEGWFGATTPDLQMLNPPTTSKYPIEWNETEGSDFVVNNILPSVDFAAMSIWDHWLPTNSTSGESLRPLVLLQFWEKWITGHISASERFLDKPVLLEAIGVRRASQEGRNPFFKLAFDLMFESFKGRGAGAGTCFWMLSDDAYPDYDGSTVYYPAHASTGVLIKAQAEKVQILAKREERIRYINSLVKAQLNHFGTSQEAGEEVSKLGTQRPTNNDAVSEDSVDSNAARKFRMALARHHPYVRTDPTTRQRLALEGPETGEIGLDDVSDDRVAAAAVEIRLLLILSFLFCVLALFFIYQAAFPRKRLGPRGTGLSED